MDHIYLLGLALTALLWMGVLWNLIAQFATFKYLHEDRANGGRRIVKTFVIAAGVFSAIMGGVSIVRSGGLQHAVALLQQTVNMQSGSIGDLKLQLAYASTQMGAQRWALRRQSITIKKQSFEIERQIHELAEVRSGIARAEIQISQTKSLAAAVRQSSIDALRVARVANSAAESTQRVVRDTEHQTERRLEAAQRLAAEAAAKAGVFRLPARASLLIADALGAATHGKASIACAPGLEAACTDLGAAFSRGGWDVEIARAASFFTGAGLDAQPNVNQDAGLIVWYQSRRKNLATTVSQILSSAGLHSETRAASLDNFDIGISLLFVAK